MGNNRDQLRLILNDTTRDSQRSRQGHGSRACYISGCREPACRAANAGYQRDYRNKLRGTHDNRQGPYRVDT